MVRLAARISGDTSTTSERLQLLYRNEQFLGEQKVDLAAGKNLFTFPQSLDAAGFYSYRVELEAPGDLLPQNNHATSFTSVRGEPRVLVVSAEPTQDAQLIAALTTASWKSNPSASPACHPRWLSCKASTPSSSATSRPAIWVKTR